MVTDSRGCDFFSLPPTPRLEVRGQFCSLPWDPGHSRISSLLPEGAAPGISASHAGEVVSY